jgi:hypothetical protein
VKKKKKNPNQNALRPHDYPGGFFGCVVESPDASGDPRLSQERKVGSLRRSAGGLLLCKPKRGEEFLSPVEGRSVAELDGLEKLDRDRLVALMRERTEALGPLWPEEQLALMKCVEDLAPVIQPSEEDVIRYNHYITTIRDDEVEDWPPEVAQKVKNLLPRRYVEKKR